MITTALYCRKPRDGSHPHSWKQRRVLIDEAAFFDWVNSQGAAS